MSTTDRPSGQEKFHFLPNTAGAQPTSGFIPLNTTGAAPGIVPGSVTMIEFPMTPMRSVLLLELFDTGWSSRSTGIYWAGKTNQIVANHDGVPITYDVFKARQIALEYRDLAESLAEALNNAAGPQATNGTGRYWRAVEHGFS